MSLDNGYMSSSNISALADAKVDAYIAAGKGEKDSLPDKISKSNFSYDSQKDIFICPVGVVLKLKSSGENRVYKAEEMVCGGCSFQKRCSVKRNDIATIYTDDKAIILATMKEKMKKDLSKEIYRKRKIIVEPVFGHIKTNGFRRFSLREFEKAGGEFSIVCMVSNFKKIVSKIKSEINCIKEVELVPTLS